MVSIPVIALSSLRLFCFALESNLDDNLVKSNDKLQLNVDWITQEFNLFNLMKFTKSLKFDNKRWRVYWLKIR